MEEFFVETGLEVSDINVKPPPFTNEQKERLASIAPKYGVELASFILVWRVVTLFFGSLKRQ